MSLKKKMEIDENTDFVVISPVGEETASVLVVNKDRAVRVDAVIWTGAQWDQYINRRIEAAQDGHSLGMSLLENEK